MMALPSRFRKLRRASKAFFDVMLGGGNLEPYVQPKRERNPIRSRKITRGIITGRVGHANAWRLSELGFCSSKEVSEAESGISDDQRVRCMLRLAQSARCWSAATDLSTNDFFELAITLFLKSTTDREVEL